MPGWLVIDIGDQLCGGGFDGDLVTECFEFADASACLCLRAIDAAGEVVRAQVAVGGGLGEYMPDDDNESVSGPAARQRRRVALTIDQRLDHVPGREGGQR